MAAGALGVGRGAEEESADAKPTPERREGNLAAAGGWHALDRLRRLDGWLRPLGSPRTPPSRVSHGRRPRRGELADSHRFGSRDRRTAVTFLLRFVGRNQMRRPPAAAPAPETRVTSGRPRAGRRGAVGRRDQHVERCVSSTPCRPSASIGAAFSAGLLEGGASAAMSGLVGRNPSEELLPSPLIVIGRSVFSRSVRHGTPSTVVSSCTPPESVSTSGAAPRAPGSRDSRAAR